MTKQPESKLSHQIMEALRARGVFCFKVHGNEMMMSGLPDIIACVPVWVDDRWYGQFVGFETKMPGGGDPTPKQHRVHVKISEAAGIVFVIRSVDQVDDMLAYVGWVMPDDEPNNLDKASMWHGWKNKAARRAMRRDWQRG